MKDSGYIWIGSVITAAELQNTTVCDRCKDNLRHVKSDYRRCRGCAIECDMCHKKHNPLNDCDESEYGL
jgi:hypothetical protein